MFSATQPRNRFVSLCAVASVIALGLASRRWPGLLPQVLGKYPGDALWTLMVFFGLGVFMPRSNTWHLALWALLISYAVEFAQLYQAPWIMAIRATTLGRLALGTTFAWFDLVAYTVGAAMGIVICEVLMLRRTLFSRHSRVDGNPSDLA
jgi:hypothetical protein